MCEEWRLLTFHPYRRADRSTCYQKDTRQPPCWSTCTPSDQDFSGEKIDHSSSRVLTIFEQSIVTDREAGDPRDMLWAWYSSSVAWGHWVLGKHLPVLLRYRDQLEQTGTNLVICEQSSFLLCGFHPEPAWADVVWGLPALRARSDDLVLKLLCLSPLSDTWQTEAMGAVGKNSKSGQKRIKNVKLSSTTTMLYLASPFGLSRTVSIQMPQVFSLLLATAKLSSMSLSCSWRHSARWPRRWSRWVGWSTWDSVCVKLWTGFTDVSLPLDRSSHIAVHEYKHNQPRI